MLQTVTGKQPAKSIYIIRWSQKCCFGLLVLEGHAWSVTPVCCDLAAGKAPTLMTQVAETMPQKCGLE